MAFYQKLLRVKLMIIIIFIFHMFIGFIYQSQEIRDRTDVIPIDIFETPEHRTPFIEHLTTKIRDVANIMQERKEVQAEKCKKVTSNETSRDIDFLTHMQYIPHYKMVFCAVEKAGSTFWRRLIQLFAQGIVDSPYSIKPENSRKIEMSFRKAGIKNLSFIPQDFRKFFFVRDPYSRLLAGYTDKLFSPNPYFWRVTGEKAVKFNRKGVTKTCGHDLTFEELLNYITHAPEQIEDEHYIPASEHCRPCLANYDFIGKMESFTRDVIFILDQYKMENYIRHLKNIKEDAITDAIYDTSQAFTSMRTSFVRCMSTEDAMKRIWRKLQIRGIIADELDIPIETLWNSRKISQMELYTVLLKAHDNSLVYDLKAQKRKYLINAYSNISKSIMQRIQTIFQSDFVLLSYDPQPDYLYRSDDQSMQIDVFKV